MAHVVEQGPGGRVEWEQWRLARLESLERFVVQMVECERAIINEAIELCLGNRREAAIRLGMSVTTMYRKLGKR